MINENCNDIVKNFYIKDRVDSDHMPLILEIEEDGETEKRKIRKRRGRGYAGTRRQREHAWKEQKRCKGKKLKKRRWI